MKLAGLARQSFTQHPFNFVTLSHSHLIKNGHRDTLYRLGLQTRPRYLYILFFSQFIAAHHTNPGPLVFPLEVVTSIRRRYRLNFSVPKRRQNVTRSSVAANAKTPSNLRVSQDWCTGDFVPHKVKIGHLSTVEPCTLEEKPIQSPKLPE